MKNHSSWDRPDICPKLLVHLYTCSQNEYKLDLNLYLYQNPINNYSKKGHYGECNQYKKQKKNNAQTRFVEHDMFQKLIKWCSSRGYLWFSNWMWLLLHSILVIGGMTFDATVHVCNDKAMFKIYEDVPNRHVVFMGNHDTTKVHGKGIESCYSHVVKS